MLKSLRFSDFVVLAMALFGIAAAARLVGMTSPLAIVVLSMGWTCPAARTLIEWRRGRRAERRISVKDRSGAAVVLLFGATPWIVLSLMHELHVRTFISTIDFPLAVKSLGIVITTAAIIGPLCPGWIGRAAVGQIGLVEALGLAIVAGSVPFALLAAGSFLAVCATNWPAQCVSPCAPKGLGLWSEQKTIVSLLSD